jgi:8-oxo-dGTP pyrophosphatase MutT (NUDIX family)
MVVNDQNEILFIKFSELKGKVAGFYDFPGGHIEKAEGLFTLLSGKFLKKRG